jgi:EAL and modified HD-GYP domain-containing signal transduction protein
MAVQTRSANEPESSPLEWTGETCSVARQPILNQSGRLYGYELLFRDQPGTARNAAGDASIGALVDDALIFGLDRFTNGFPAFISSTAEALAGQLVQILPPELTVLAIAENVEPAPALLEACRELKSRGFRFALDDYTGSLHPLLELADFVRVDFSAPGAVGRERLRNGLGESPAAMVAKRVETEEDYQRAGAEGFTLFQGDYLVRPALVKGRKVPPNRLFQFEILRSLYQDPVDLKKLSHLVMRDAALTYRLLRLVNSPVCALRQEVRSVESAIIIVGLDTFRRFATLAILGEGSSAEHPEILHMALVRARFCELAARTCRLDAPEQYLLGMFSLLPAMLRVPMSELTPALPLRDEVRQALEGTQNRERCLLQWLESHEHGQWDDCDSIVQANRLSQERLIRCYGDSVVWAQAALRSAEEGDAAAS